MAASRGHSEVVELLLSKGANVEAANKVMNLNLHYNNDLLKTGFRRLSRQNNRNIH